MIESVRVVGTGRAGSAIAARLRERGPVPGSGSAGVGPWLMGGAIRQGHGIVDLSGDLDDIDDPAGREAGPDLIGHRRQSAVRAGREEDCC